MALHEQRMHYELLEIHLKVETNYILMSYRRKRILWIFILLYIIKIKLLLMHKIIEC